MVTNLDPANAQFVAQMKNIQTRMQRAQTQVASGKRVTAVSDDPDQISDLLSARAALSSAKQINANLGRVQTEVNAAEKGLSQASLALERARVLGAQGANGTQTPDTRATLATEVESILSQLVGISRTTVEGRFIFSGDTDTTAPYSIDLTQTNPISAYAGAATTTRQIQHPNGTRFTISKSAQEIFDSADPALNVFQNVTSLRNALRANDEAAIQTSLDNLASAAPYLERMLAYYGTAQNRLAEAVDYGKKLDLELTAQIANIENADTTSAILEMQQAAVQQQAALQSKAQMQRKSLFDYLG
jgi:flagellar hook-associated protein 3 FlgL